MKEKEIRYDNYPDYQKPYLKVLLEEEIIKVDDKGLIYISNDDEIKILKHLYHYRAFPCYSFRKENQIITDKMFERGWILEDNHLLSPEERNYFSYYLNNKSFTNGPSIRNTYMHGNNSSPEKEREHQRNYYRILILFVLILIKIEEDLSLKMSIKLE